MDFKKRQRKDVSIKLFYTIYMFYHPLTSSIFGQQLNNNVHYNFILTIA